MHYTYVLISEADRRFYMGATIKTRLASSLSEIGSTRVGTALGMAI